MRKLVHSATLLMVSGFAAQSLQFIGTIFLARIYDPDAYGNLTLIVNWASVFAVICSLQLHIALHVAQSEDVARELQTVALITVPTLAMPALFIAWILGTDTLILAILLGASLALANIGRSALARRSANLCIAGLTIGRAALAVMAQFGLRSVGQGGLVLGLLVAEVTAAIAFLGFSIRTGSRLKRVRPVQVILENRNFTGWGVAQELVAIAVVFLPFLICSLVYDTSVVGHYGVAYRLLWAPAVILSFGFGLVFLTELSRNPERFKEILEEIRYRWLVLIIIAVSATSVFWMPRLFLLVLGNEWQLAANMSPAVAMAAASFLISAPFRQLYRVRQKQSLQLRIDLATAVMIAAAWFLPPMEPVVWVYVISGIVVLQNVLMVGVTRSIQP